uniref:BH3-interacting domain death agonist n=1 Tax=Poecilia reticulata TaxID=8081 RepID=A0A3P9Q8R4_POERE
MGDLVFLADQQSAALVVFFFLQPDSKDLNYNEELCSKGNELIASREINDNGNQLEAEEHGELQADGHLPGNITGCLDDVLPLLGNHLVNEVERLLREVSVKDLPQEQVVVALTLTLVKGVCIQAPRLLKGLFDTAVQFICHRWTR